MGARFGLIAASAISLVLTANSAWADECDTILSQGIRNTFSDLKKDNFERNFSSKYCDSSRFSNSSGHNVQAGGGQFGYWSVEGSKTDRDTQESQRKNCGEQNSLSSDSDFVTAMKSVADEGIVNAWSECRKSTFGLIIEGDLNGKELVLTYRFRAAGNVNQAKLTAPPKIKGAKCKDQLTAGQIIGTGTYLQSCERIGVQEVSVIVNSNRGGAKFFVPKVLPKPVPSPEPDPAKKCGAWDGTGTRPQGCEKFCRELRGPGRSLVCISQEELCRTWYDPIKKPSGCESYCREVRGPGVPFACP
jgi:hypothetical protein